MIFQSHVIDVNLVMAILCSAQRQKRTPLKCIFLISLKYTFFYDFNKTSIQYQTCILFTLYSILSVIK